MITFIMDRFICFHLEKIRKVVRNAVIITPSPKLTVSHCFILPTEQNSKLLKKMMLPVYENKKQNVTFEKMEL